ncbi:MAG: hypothetical protein WA445_25015 [Pseudolabrys sp.]
MADAFRHTYIPRSWKEITDYARALWAVVRRYIPRSWSDVLDFAHVLWVIRIPVCALAVGFALLCLVPQAQDLLVELIEYSWHVVFFLALVFFVWASTTHYTARLLLDTDERFRARVAERNTDFIKGWEILLPRLLGALAFVAVFLSAERSIENLPVIDDPYIVPYVTRMLRWFQVVTLAALGLFIWYLLSRQALSALPPVRTLESKTGFVTRFLRRLGIEPKLDSNNVGPLMLFAVFLICAVILLFSPVWVARWFPRSLAVPLLLGAWVPFLSLLSGIGRRYGAPVIAGVAFVFAILSFLFGDNHSVRRIDAAQTLGRQPNGAEVSLNRAVDTWMNANGCKQDPAKCPRPILVAAAGGASRAGFFTASIIGYLLDTAKEKDPRLDASEVTKRLFAISGVSGGSVGAAMTTAAMARTKSGEQPCVERRPSLWYGDTIGNWRDCLEALSAGDFLTPVSIGLVFRDTVRFGWWEDRATALERSWEERFSQLAGSDTDKWPEQCPGDLRCPFMTSRPQESHWIPLLVLNGVSSATGRRILTTVLASDYHPKATCPVAGAMKTDANIKATAAQIFKSAVSGPARQCSIFLESVRFHDLLANKNPPNWLGRIQRLAVWDYVRNKLPFLTPRNLDDIRLSTAAHNSARFPIVSPAGEIRNRQHQVVDRIVDGGYFENYGALGAMELAQAIRAIEPKLAPFALVISNDPDEDPDLTKVDVADDAVLADVSVPIAAVVNTRTSRGRLAVGQLEAAMESVAEPDCGGGTAHIRVWPRFQQTANGDLENVSRPISMSWWLSRPIQILLHQQTEENKNQNKNPDQIERVWRAIMSKSDCTR